jgi:hypothetical protein
MSTPMSYAISVQKKTFALAFMAVATLSGCAAGVGIGELESTADPIGDGPAVVRTGSSEDELAAPPATSSASDKSPPSSSQAVVSGALVSANAELVAAHDGTAFIVPSDESSVSPVRAPIDACDGQEASFASDALNCGSCGNVCSGGVCVDGVCALAAPQRELENL